MITCAICNGACVGHHGKISDKDTQHLELQDSPEATLQSLKRDGLQPKDSVKLADDSLWMVKYDRSNLTFAAVNEWLTMSLVDSLGFDTPDYALARLGADDAPQAALFVKYFDFMQGDAQDCMLKSGLNVVQKSATLAYRVESQMETTDMDEFHIVHEMLMKDMTLFDAVNVFRDEEIASDDMQTIFRFFVMSELLSHTDCHLGNVGFLHDLKTDQFSLSPVYDVNNFAVYNDSRRVLRASMESSDLNIEQLELLAKKCDVDDWEPVVEEMISVIKTKLPEAIAEVRETEWLKDLHFEDTCIGPKNLTDFLESYSNTVQNAVASFAYQPKSQEALAEVPEITIVDLLDDAIENENYDAGLRMCTVLFTSLEDPEFALDTIPITHPRRTVLENFMEAAWQTVDKNTGLHENNNDITPKKSATR